MAEKSIHIVTPCIRSSQLSRIVGRNVFLKLEIGKYSIESSVVSDDMAIQSILHFADDQRMIVEPACGAALAPLYFNQIPERSGPIVVIVCGGAVIHLDKINKYRKTRTL